MILLVAAAACPLLADLEAKIPNASISELTRRQMLFLEGIYATHPQTPAGLPEGDTAWLVTIKGKGEGTVFFSKGKDQQVCATPFDAPKELQKLIDEVAHGPGDDL